MKQFPCGQANALNDVQCFHASGTALKAVAAISNQTITTLYEVLSAIVQVTIVEFALGLGASRKVMIKDFSSSATPIERGRTARKPVSLISLPKQNRIIFASLISGLIKLSGI